MAALMALEIKRMVMLAYAAGFFSGIAASALAVWCLWTAVVRSSG